MDRYFGIDIGGTEIKWALVTEEYLIEERGSIPTAFSSQEEVVEACAQLIEPYKTQVVGIGVSAPGGFVEGDTDGVIHRGGALTYMDGCPLGKILRERFGMPCAVGNDGKLGALGEYAAGALKGTRVGVLIGIGTGIAGGIIINGRVLQGAHGFAAELSFPNNNLHNVWNPMDMFATTAGWKALRDRVLAEKGMEKDSSIDGRKIFEWIDAGDEAAQRGLDAYALEFDNWLVNLQAIIDPDAFAISGGISANPHLTEAMENQLDTALAQLVQVFGNGFPRPVIRRAQLGNDANIYGAVYAVRQLAEEA